MEEQNQRLTRGWPVVDKRLISGTASALRSWLLTSVPTPICLCKPFSCKACPGTTCRPHNCNKSICLVRNPKIPRAVRFGAAHSGTAGRSKAGQNRMLTGRVAQKPNVLLTLQGIVNNFLQRSFASTNNWKSYVKRWRNKTRG